MTNLSFLIGHIGLLTPRGWTLLLTYKGVLVEGLMCIVYIREVL